MSETMYQRKPNRPTPSVDAAEAGERVDPASVSRPRYLPGTLESIPEDIKALRPWAGWNAEYRPDITQKTPWTEVPKNPRTGPSASPTAFQASHIFVDRSRQLLLSAHHAKTEGLSREGHVIPARGGLSHG